jgi:hypothetical protein
MRRADFILNLWLSGLRRPVKPGHGAALSLAILRSGQPAVQSGDLAHEHNESDFGGNLGGGGDDGGGGDGSGGQWVTVATFWASEAAHVARLRLESHGVRCMILDEYLVATDWLLAQAAGGIKLQVQQSCLAQAREILTEGMARLSGSMPGSATAPGRADRLADWIAGHLQAASRNVRQWLGRGWVARRWVGRPGRRWWLGALLPVTLAGQALPPARGQMAGLPATNPTAPVCGVAAA